MKTLENCEESISIDPEDKEFKETIKNARKKLETSVAPAMPCNIAKNCESGASNWKLMNLKTILQKMVKIHYSTTTWFTNLFLCLKL